MTRQNLLRELQRYAANVAVGASALRNQGTPGMVRVAREFLSRLDLSRITPAAFRRQLDKWTDQLVHKFPKGGRVWGAARKVLNIFLFQASMNRHLSKAYRLDRLSSELELPLDNGVAKKLEHCSTPRKPSKWQGVKYLKPKINQEYQDLAREEAKKRRLPGRAYLDTIWWRAPKKPNT